MKTIFKILIIGLISCISFSTFAQFGGPEPHTVCEIVAFPVDELDVITVGVVGNAIGDQFELTFGGCTILCDVTFASTPSEGLFIAVDGRVQEEDLFEDLKIQVRYWIPYTEDPPLNQDPIVFTAEDANNSEIGTVALLFGKMVSYSDEEEGIGTFVDETASIFINFIDGDSPATQQNIYILGVVEENNATNPEIEVIYWYPEGGEPPPEPPAVAWSIEDVNTLPLGSVCFILGSMTSWTNMTLGIGVYDDSVDTIGTNFEEDVLSLPNLDDSIFVFGNSAEVIGVRVITAHAWIEEEGLLGVDDPIYLKHIVKVYPNPVSDALYLQSKQEMNSIFIRNILGQEVYSSKIKSLNYSVDVSNFTSGVYFVKVTVGYDTVIKKFIKD